MRTLILDYVEHPVVIRTHLATEKAILGILLDPGGDCIYFTVEYLRSCLQMVPTPSCSRPASRGRWESPLRWGSYPSRCWRSNPFEIPTNHERTYLKAHSATLHTGAPDNSFNRETVAKTLHTDFRSKTPPDDGNHRSDSLPDPASQNLKTPSYNGYKNNNTQRYRLPSVFIKFNNAVQYSIYAGFKASGVRLRKTLQLTKTPRTC